MDTPEKAGLSFERESNPLAKEISPDRTSLLVSFRDEVKLPKPLVEAIIAGGVLVSALNDSDKKLGRRELLGGSLLFAALAGLSCNRGQPESTPTPDPTPLPSPTATLKKPDATPTRIPPTPTAVVINLPPVVGGPEPRPTPTPDIQRENLAQKAADYYLKNPLIDVLNNRPFSGVVVSERDTDGNLLISIRTLSGERLEDSVLAGNWGYFALNEKNEVTGIIWAKQDTFKDSKGNVGYLGDSTIATKGAGWFGMEQMGYWTKDKKLIATVDPKTGEAKEIIPIPEFKGLKLEGFTQKYDPEKQLWTYLDADGKKIAYWDEKGNEGKGRIELAGGVKGLDFEKHKSLFVGRDIQECEAAFLEAQKTGEVKIPVPFNIEKIKGELKFKQDLVNCLDFANVQSGNTLRSPFKGTVTRGALGDAKGNIYASKINLWFIQDKFGLEIVFPTPGEYIGPDYGTVSMGLPIVKFSENTISPKLSAGLYRGDQISIAKMGELAKSESPDFTFENIQKDNLGRLIYLR